MDATALQKREEFVRIVNEVSIDDGKKAVPQRGANLSLLHDHKIHENISKHSLRVHL